MANASTLPHETMVIGLAISLAIDIAISLAIGLAIGHMTNL